MRGVGALVSLTGVCVRFGERDLSVPSWEWSEHAVLGVVGVLYLGANEMLSLGAAGVLYLGANGVLSLETLDYRSPGALASTVWGWLNAPHTGA